MTSGISNEHFQRHNLTTVCANVIINHVQTDSNTCGFWVIAYQVMQICESHQTLRVHWLLFSNKSLQLRYTDAMLQNISVQRLQYNKIHLLFRPPKRFKQLHLVPCCQRHASLTLPSVSVAQWASRYSACWPDGLRTLAGLGSNPGLEESFSAGFY